MIFQRQAGGEIVLDHFFVSTHVRQVGDRLRVLARKEKSGFAFMAPDGPEKEGEPDA